MNIEIPTAPAGVLVLLSFFAPYAIAALNGALPFVKKPWQRKAVALIVSLVLTAIVLAFYYALTGDTVPSWPTFVLLSLVIASASYALVTKTSAAKVESKLDPSSQ
jgi:peptidoglycan/LPS O-acetylase OafA/YrhL